MNGTVKKQRFCSSGTQIDTCKATSTSAQVDNKLRDTDKSVKEPRQLIFYFQQWVEGDIGSLLNTTRGFPEEVTFPHELKLWK